MKQRLPDLTPLMKNGDVQEGLAAFFKRREASFTGELRPVDGQYRSC